MKKHNLPDTGGYFNRILGGALGVCLFFVSFLYASELRVYYVSVGQGDSEYIELPNGENVLIDGGPNSSDSTLNPIIKFLEAKGVKEIKLVFLSHSHADHYSGLMPVFSRYKIGTYYDSFITIPFSAGAESFRTLAKNKALSYVNTTTMDLVNGATFYSITTSTPPLYFVMHHRGDAYAGSIKSANDTSLIFKIIFGSSTFIFGGDAGYSGSYKPLELAVAGLSSPPNPSGIKLINSTADCYKVHHHGSSTSSSDGLLNVIKPKYAFIGVGLGNSFGHPTVEALTRIKNAISTYHPEVRDGGHYGTGIFATDYDGSIEVVTTGDGNYKVTKNYVPTSSSGGTSGGGTTTTTTTTGSGGEYVSFVNALNNLFNPAKGEWLRIEYYLNNPGESVFRVYTVSGEMVYEERKRDDYAGDLKAWVWNGKNSDGKIVAPGAYFIFVKTPDLQIVKQAVVIR